MVVHFGHGFIIPGSDCGYPKFLSFIGVTQNLFMIVLFSDFYWRAYGKKKQQKKIEWEHKQIWNPFRNPFSTSPMWSMIIPYPMVKIAITTSIVTSESDWLISSKLRERMNGEERGEERDRISLIDFLTFTQ